MKIGGLQVGGGINSDNSLSYIDEGASHVIVTSVCYNYCSLNLLMCKQKNVKYFYDLVQYFIFLSHQNVWISS